MTDFSGPTWLNLIGHLPIGLDSSSPTCNLGIACNLFHTSLGLSKLHPSNKYQWYLIRWVDICREQAPSCQFGHTFFKLKDMVHLGWDHQNHGLGGTCSSTPYLRLTQKSVVILAHEFNWWIMITSVIISTRANPKAGFDGSLI